MPITPACTIHENRFAEKIRTESKYFYGTT